MKSTRRDVFISWADLLRLEHQIEMTRLQPDGDDEHLDRLKARLDRAQIIGRDGAPAEVVTMHSRMRLRDPETGKAVIYELVFPNRAEPGQGKISILAPLGAALLGASEGERVSWATPAGPRELLLEMVLYQPEVEEERL